jgi:preprotein translocase subunit SecD
MRKWNKWILVAIAVIFGLSLWYVLPASGSGSATRDLVLAPDTGTISGTVTDISSGQPVAGLEVNLDNVGGEQQTPVKTDDSGKFSFADLKTGSYKLEIDRTDYDTIIYNVDLDPGEQLNLDLSSIPSNMSIKGEVLNSVSNDPVKDATVLLGDKAGMPLVSATTDSLGHYGLTVTLPGSYTIMASHTDYQAAAPTSLEFADTPLTQSFKMDPKPGQISGIINTLAGTPLSGAVINLYKDSTLVTSATSDATGAYSFADVSQGSYTLTVTQGAYLEMDLLLQVSANQTIKQDVSLNPPNISVEGSVTDSVTKAPLSKATVTVSRTPKGTETSEVLYTMLTDKQGHYAFAGLPYGVSLTLTASKSGYKSLNRSSSVLSFSRKGFHFGLDLKGGSQIVLKANFEGTDITSDQDKSDAVKAAASNIEKRINAYGVSDPVVQRVGSDRILVELPGIKNTDEAVNLIGQQAKLDFRVQRLDAQGNQVLDENGNPIWDIATGTGADGKQIELTGQYFKGNVAVQLDQSNKPEVAFEWKSEAAPAFEEVTGKLVNGNQPLGIFLDGKLISAPRVQAVISDKGVITGLSLNEARQLVIQLKSGSLPVPLDVVERHDVDPTLGPEVVKKCLVAGALGLLAVFLFMIIYYRLPGLLSGGALVVYVTAVLAIFKLIPVTLTLAGIGGFIVSIGMAVDANVIIFERLKEELRNGRAMGPATDIAFSRAWPAIRDSNFTTFIACGILYWLGSSLGVHPVQGFAITLFFGVAVSMISAIIMTRSFMWSVIGQSWANKPWQYLGLGEKSDV